MAALAGEPNPFLRYRERLDSYSAVRDGRFSDQWFVDLVSHLDARIAQVWGHGFAITPLIDGTELAEAAGFAARLSIKVETGSVAGSHKARHLMGVAIAQLVAEELGAARPERLAIASCGNAALGAAVVAGALGRRLEVFVPTWADPVVVTMLDDLDATVNRCERRSGELGDPCYLRFREATASGAAPFSVIGSDTPTAFDGARTIGWEIAEQVSAPVDALYVQVGGGALATAVSLGLPETRLYPVQAEGCAPLRRAWERWAPEFDPAVAADPNQQLMTPWDEPHSAATGILDDITYDWRPLLDRMRITGGHPIVAPESNIERAHALAHQYTSVNVSATGTAGFAGTLTEPPAANEHVVVLFTGIDRT